MLSRIRSAWFQGTLMVGVTAVGIRVLPCLTQGACGGCLPLVPMAALGLALLAKKRR